MIRLRKLTQPCSMCGGNGIVPLSQEYLEVYEQLKKMPQQRATLLQMREKFPSVSASAMNRRLGKLVALKYATQRKEKRMFVYEIASKTK